MKKVKFLHCADLHLDMPFASLGAETGKSSIRRQDLKDTFKRIINIAKEEKTDLILISGDLYEHGYVKKSTVNFINDGFGEIPDINVFITPGNHDPYIVDSYYKNFKWNENVHILTAKNPCVFLEDRNTLVHGIGFENFLEEKSLVSGLKPVDRGFINILAVHGTVDMNFTRSVYNPVASKNLASLGMDYIAAGHFHKRIDNIGKTGMIYNPGSPEPLGFDEGGDHGVFLGSLTKTDTGERKLDIDFIKTNKKFYEFLEVDVSGCGADESVISGISDAVRNKGCNAMLDIKLKGYVENGFLINTAYIRSFYEDRFFFIKIKDETMADYNFDEIMKGPDLKGLFTRKIFSLIKTAEDECRKELLKKALYYGLEALEQGRVDPDTG